MAIDVADYASWKPYLEAQGCKWYGTADVVHFDCPGTSIIGTSVLAFQKLWNCNNPNDQIVENGIYGQDVEDRILQSQANGFPLSC